MAEHKDVALAVTSSSLVLHPNREVAECMNATVRLRLVRDLPGVESADSPLHVRGLESHPLYQFNQWRTDMKFLICMMGLPRSGKSTHARELSARYGAPIVNRDSIRLALHGNRYEKNAESMVKSIVEIMVRSLFLAGHDRIIVDETNLTLARRDFWRIVAGESVEVCFVHISTEPSICKERAIATGQEDLIEIIGKMHKDTQPLTSAEEISLFLDKPKAV